MSLSAEPTESDEVHPRRPSEAVSVTGVAANGIRVDVAIRSETLEFGAAVASLAAQPTSLSGRVLLLAELRGLGTSPPLSATDADA